MEERLCGCFRKARTGGSSTPSRVKSLRAVLYMLSHLDHLSVWCIVGAHVFDK